jgi:hypothetical protein
LSTIPRFFSTSRFTLPENCSRVLAMISGRVEPRRFSTSRKVFDPHYLQRLHHPARAGLNGSNIPWRVPRKIS